MCPPNTDVTISAIYRCHWGGRRAGAEPPGQRSARPGADFGHSKAIFKQGLGSWPVGPFNPVT